MTNLNISLSRHDLAEYPEFTLNSNKEEVLHVLGLALELIQDPQQWCAGADTKPAIIEFGSRMVFPILDWNYFDTEHHIQCVMPIIQGVGIAQYCSVGALNEVTPAIMT